MPKPALRRIVRIIVLLALALLTFLVKPVGFVLALRLLQRTGPIDPALFVKPADFILALLRSPNTEYAGALMAVAELLPWNALASVLVVAAILPWLNWNALAVLLVVAVILAFLGWNAIAIVLVLLVAAATLTWNANRREG